VQRYTDGTSAYKLEKTELKKRKAVKKGKSKARRTRGVKTVFGILAVTALAFLLLFRYAMITEKTAQVQKLTAELQNVDSYIVQKECEMEQSLDLKKVEEIATTKLGMQRPEKHQLVYIDMNNKDYAEKSGKDTNSTPGLLAYISGGIQSIVEYFR